MHRSRSLCSLPAMLSTRAEFGVPPPTFGSIAHCKHETEHNEYSCSSESSCERSGECSRIKCPFQVCSSDYDMTLPIAFCGRSCDAGQFH